MKDPDSVSVMVETRVKQQFRNMQDESKFKAKGSKVRKGLDGTIEIQWGAIKEAIRAAISD